MNERNISPHLKKTFIVNIIQYKFTQIFAHLKREIGISLRNLIADAFCKIVEFDIILVGRVSIRSKELRSLILLTNLLFFPYDDTLDHNKWFEDKIFLLKHYVYRKWNQRR